MHRMFKWGLGVFAAVLLVSWITSAQGEQPTTAPVKGSITGVVMYDGQPVNGAVVRLIKPVRPALGQRQAAKAQAADPANPAKPGKAAKGKGANAANKQQPIATAKTDDHGKFTFTDVAPGDYAVAVALKGQANGRARVHVSAGGTASVTIQMRERPANRPQL